MSVESNSGSNQSRAHAQTAEFYFDRWDADKDKVLGRKELDDVANQSALPDDQRTAARFLSENFDTLRMVATSGERADLPAGLSTDAATSRYGELFGNDENNTGISKKDLQTLKSLTDRNAVANLTSGVRGSERWGAVGDTVGIGLHGLETMVSWKVGIPAAIATAITGRFGLAGVIGVASLAGTVHGGLSTIGNAVGLYKNTFDSGVPSLEAQVERRRQMFASLRMPEERPSIRPEYKGV